MLVNLVGNAIKFTERGEVVVGVGIEDRGQKTEDRRQRTEDSKATSVVCPLSSVLYSESSVLLHFEVRDTGIGIPPEKRQAIFDAFTQADGSTTRKYGGTGLGLTISARLVALMGGRLWVESEVGRGQHLPFHREFRRRPKDSRSAGAPPIWPRCTACAC